MTFEHIEKLSYIYKMFCNSGSMPEISNVFTEQDAWNDILNSDFTKFQEEADEGIYNDYSYLLDDSLLERISTMIMENGLPETKDKVMDMLESAITIAIGEI